jgi:hypothetical protein
MMAVIDRKTIASIEKLYDRNAINVSWRVEKVFEETGEVLFVSPDPHRASFGRYERAGFLAAVPGAEADADAVGLEFAPAVTEPVTE